MSRLIDTTTLPSLPFECRTHLPEESGLYFVIDRLNRVLYVGVASNFHRRWTSHGHGMIPALRGIEGTRIAWATMTRKEAAALEQHHIKTLNPPFNSTGNKKPDAVFMRPILFPDQAARIAYTQAVPYTLTWQEQSQLLGELITLGMKAKGIL